jgi:tape measure domain-containing protein
MADLGQLSVEIKASLREFELAMNKMSSKLDLTAKSVEDSNGRMAKSFSVVDIAIGNLIARGFEKLLEVSKEFAQASLQTSMNLEDNAIAFETMIGSGEKAQKFMQDLADFSLKTPFTLPEIQENAKKLMAYGIAIDEVLPTLKNLGDISAGVGKEKLPFLTLALGQVRTAGKLTGNELRQFTEAGVPLLDELAKMTGKSASKIKDDMEKGIAPSFAQVQKALQNMTGDGGKFFNLMEKRSTSMSGILSNLSDLFTFMSASFMGVSTTGEIQEGGLFDTIKTSLEQLLVYLNQNRAKIAEFAQQIAVGLQTAFKFIAENKTEIIGALKGISIALGGLVAIKTIAMGFTLLTNPLTILIAVAGLLGMAWETNFGGIQEKTKAVWDFLQKTFGQLFEWFSNNLPIGLDIFQSKSEGTFTFLTETFQNFWNFLSPIFQQIYDWFAVIIPPIVDYFVSTWTTRWNQLQPTIERLKLTLKAIADFAQVIFGFLVSQFQKLYNDVSMVVGIIYKVIVDNWETIMAVTMFIWQRIQGYFEFLWQGILNTINFYLDMIRGVVQIFTGIFTGDWNKIWEGIKTIFVGVWDFLVAEVGRFIGLISSIIFGSKDTIKNTASDVWNGISDTFLEVKEKIEKWIKELMEKIENLVNSIKDAPGNLAKGAKNLGGKIADKLGFASGGFKGTQGTNFRAENGLVPSLRGVPNFGDKLLTRINPREMVLNLDQQAMLFDAIRSGSLGGGSSVNINIDGNVVSNERAMMDFAENLDRVRSMRAKRLGA